MKRRLKGIFALVIILVIITTGCQNTKNSKIIKKNKEIVLKTHTEVWSKGNIDIIDKLYSSDYVAHWVSGGDTGIEDFKNMIIEARNTFPDLNEEVIHIVAEEDLVVTHFISSGTFLGEMSGIQPTGKKGSRPEMAVHRLENGKIVEQWTVADLLTLTNQLGIEL